MVSLRGVRRHFVTPVETVRAVDGVSFEAGRGTLTCLMGPSGSGKTTVLRLLAGLDLPDTGEVEVAGHRLHTLTPSARALVRARDVGVVFQHHNLVDEFTAAENVALPLELLGAAPRPALHAAQVLLARVGLEGLGRRRPAELSGGQRQRVGIARGLAGGRTVLLADEPTGSLDQATAREVFQLLRGLCDDGLTAVVCTHDPQGALVADRTLHMTDGLVHETAPTPKAPR